MQTKKFPLIDEQTSPELKAAYKAAARNQSAVQAAFRVITALHALIDEAGFQHEMEIAVQQSMATGANVADLLREREVNLHEQIVLAQTDKRAYEAACAARKADVQPVLNACMDELFRLGDEMKALQKQIEGFNASRTRAAEKYKTAGLTDADIEAIGGIKPTHDDLAEWKRALEVKQMREDQITQFFKSSPDFDLSILGNATTKV